MDDLLPPHLILLRTFPVAACTLFYYGCTPCTACFDSFFFFFFVGFGFSYENPLWVFYVGCFVWSAHFVNFFWECFLRYELSRVALKYSWNGFGVVLSCFCIICCSDLQSLLFFVGGCYDLGHFFVDTSIVTIASS